MKKFKIKKKDAYDLQSVLADVVVTNSDTLDFKDILTLQKTANEMKIKCGDFAEKQEEYTKESTELAKIAQKRIENFKETLISDVRKTKDVSKYNESVEAFSAMELDTVRLQIAESIQPKLDVLYEKEGVEEIEIELEESKMKVIVDNFEKFGNKKYTNKSKMIEVYDILSNAS